MISRKSKWSSSVTQSDIHFNDLTRTRDAYLRPTSAVPSRPEGPPDPRIVAMGTQGQRDRPKSGVRPLSGNIFMRCSSKHGWVAKAYSERHSTSSQSNLDLDHFTDGNLECESFDSFFDDDFEEQNQTEELGNFLSCNTLGVETKAMKQDWISGEIDIPTFHCPRCRDHWYGISSFPCDEELARLIREGLWKTGNTGKDDTNQSSKLKDVAFKSGKLNEKESYHSALDERKLPFIKHGNFHLSKGTSESSSWEMRRKQEELKNKRKKRITFQLDDDTQSGGSNSSMDQDMSGAGSGNTSDSKGGTLGGSGIKDEGSGATCDYDASNGRGGDKERSGGGDGNRREEGDRREGIQKMKRGDMVTDSNVERLVDSGLELMASENRRRGNKSKGNRDNLIGSDSSSQQESGRHKGGDKSANRSMSGGGGVGSGNNMGLRGQNQISAANSHGSESKEGWDSGTNVSGEEQGVGQRVKDGEGQEMQGGKNRYNLDDDSSSRSESGASQDSKTEKSVTKPTDYGKRIRKSGGYMRAVSPTSSEWGDPLHARSFISSTATSRMGSNSDLTADEDGSSSSNTFLPPIVHPIHRPPTLTNLDWGPDITRPWTFSYH